MASDMRSFVGSPPGVSGVPGKLQGRGEVKRGARGAGRLARVPPPPSMGHAQYVVVSEHQSVHRHNLHDARDAVLVRGLVQVKARDKHLVDAPRFLKGVGSE